MPFLMLSYSKCSHSVRIIQTGHCVSKYWSRNILGCRLWEAVFKLKVTRRHTKLWGILKLTFLRVTMLPISSEKSLNVVVRIVLTLEW